MSLRAEDLKYLLYDTFEIDNYSSKMGSDEDVVVLSFALKEKEPAKDLVKFIESGYPFVLDADVSPGELEDGTYKVFVELERNRDVADQINELLDGVRKISGVNNLKYRYHKNFKSKDATLENLASIPTSAQDYLMSREQVTMENYKNFFADSYVDNVTMISECLTFQKRYAEPLHFRVIDFGDSDSVYKNLNESYNINDFAQVIFLSKYIGEYNIAKYGNKFSFDKDNKTLILQKIV